MNILLGEMLAARELVRLPARSLRLATTRRGDGRAAVLFPGFSTNDLAMLPLRKFLQSRGHDAHGWGLGVNDGDVFGKIGACVDLVTGLAESSGRPVSLVGWSLGGVFAREVAREAPEAVHRVVTFGTPLNGPPPSVADRVYSEGELEQIHTEIKDRDQRPIEVPITAMCSRADRIVAWKTCRDNLSADVEHREVTSTHAGMLLDPDVWETVAERLGE